MSFPRTPLAKLVAQLSRVQCVWKDDQQPRLENSHIKLSVFGYDAIGDDEYRQKPNAKNPLVLDSILVGQRKIIISMRARSLDASEQAYELLERVRIGLGTFTTRAFLRDNRVSVITFKAIVPVSGGVVNSRALLDANFDVTFGYVSVLKTTDDPGETIGTVNGGTGIPITEPD